MQLQFIVALLIVLALCEGCAGMRPRPVLGGNDRGKSTNFTNSSNQPETKGKKKLKMFSSGSGSQTKNQNSSNFGGSNTSTYPGMINFGASGDVSQTENENSINFGGSNSSTYPGLITFEGQTTDPNAFSEIVNLPTFSGINVKTEFSKEMKKERFLEEQNKKIIPFEKLNLPYFKMEGCESASISCKLGTIEVKNDAPPPPIGHAFEGLPGLQNVSRGISNFSSTPMDQSKSYGKRNKPSSNSNWSWNSSK